MGRGFRGEVCYLDVQNSGKFDCPNNFVIPDALKTDVPSTLEWHGSVELYDIRLWSEGKHLAVDFLGLKSIFAAFPLHDVRFLCQGV